MAEQPIDLTLERLNRLEQLIVERFESVDRRFESIESAVGKMVTVLEAHDQRLEHIVQRLDKLIEQTVRSRTEDASRWTDIERRLQVLEQRQP